MPGGGVRGLQSGQVSNTGELVMTLLKALSLCGTPDNNCLNQPDFERTSSLYGHWNLSKPVDMDFSLTEGMGLMSDKANLSVVYNVVARENNTF
eukprot:CAMPEP_0116882050 /NCGR_PEP_ID=MMETSP0463-20121206/14189_1 /TAXON_ID=181622 /ORGANISM="Strombidinopsis sp, Strain SopsisLIS2011" /LENGTH=93 /DNA_ID=CAMNT_0004534661 /DNA_START=236 /DNA_END=517 /DNA_ORIENTATION=+